jgi:hypothetical protein
MKRSTTSKNNFDLLCSESKNILELNPELEYEKILKAIFTFRLEK